MPAQIHLELSTAEDQHYIDADSMLTALDATLEILRELAASSGQDYEWRYTHLSIGSGNSVLEAELADPAVGPTEKLEAERGLEAGYVNGLASLEVSTHTPPGFTRKALEASLRLVSVLSDSVTGIVTYAPDTGRVAPSEHIAANVKAILGRGFTDVGSIEGRLETISLAGRPTFNVRDELTSQSVRCTLDISRLEEVKEALGHRVLIAGEVTYSKHGEPSEVSPVVEIRILDANTPPTVEEVLGIEPDITGGQPTGLYVRERFYG
jgi:hypothetical protein